MKRLARYFLILILISSGVTSAVPAAEAVEPPEIPKDLRFIYADTHYMSDQGRLDWRRSLAETPGITDKEYDLLWQFVEIKYDTQIGQTLYALGQRSDLSDDQLKRITDRMRAHSVGSLENLPSEELEFLCLGVYLLRKHPSPEHEDFALMLLEKGDSRIKSAAAGTLGKIGTRKSVEPMRQYVDSQTQMIDPSLRAAALARGSKDSLLAAQHELQARVQADERKSARENKSGSDRPGADKVWSPEDTAQANSSDGHGWTAWLVAAIIACGVIVWILRSRGHKENQ